MSMWHRESTIPWALAELTLTPAMAILANSAHVAALARTVRTMTHDVEEFADEVKATSLESNVIIPNCFQPIVIGEQNNRQ